MPIGLFVTAIVVALISGWFLGFRTRRHFTVEQKISLPRDYLVGLNFLLNEEPDKAVDVFIKMLEVDSSTVETHLAVGKLFRRRGEVERAIRIHQNLIARPELDKDYREQSLFELGQDYLCAGFLDRAERIFSDLVGVKAYSEPALRDLLHIYQQEKDWAKAIEAAAKLEIVTRKNMQPIIAHYYCEQAEIMQTKGQLEQADLLLKQALQVDAKCVRASLLQAKLEMNKGNYPLALKSLKRIKSQNADYLSEAIDPIALCYAKLDEGDKLILYFMQILEEHPSMPVMVILAEQIKHWKGNKIAANFVADYVRRHPSISGLNLFINLYLSNAEGRAREDLLILQGLTNKLLSDQPTYQCASCGFSGKSVHWQCPGCKQWSSVKPAHCFEE